MYGTRGEDFLDHFVAKTFASSVQDPGFAYRSVHTCYVKVVTLLDTLQGAWYYEVNVRTGVSVLWHAERWQFGLQPVSQCGATCNHPSRAVPESDFASCFWL